MSEHKTTVLTDFERGALAMRDKIEDMLREHSAQMKMRSEMTRWVVEIGAYRAASDLLASYANGVGMEMPPEDAGDA